MSLEETLKELAEKGTPWQRIETNVPGIFLVKVPGSKRKPATIMIELNPVDEKGNPTKRRGLYLQKRETLEQFRELINQEKLDTLIDAITKVFFSEESTPATSRPRVEI